MHIILNGTNIANTNNRLPESININIKEDCMQLPNSVRMYTLISSGTHLDTVFFFFFFILIAYITVDTDTKCDTGRPATSHRYSRDRNCK